MEEAIAHLDVLPPEDFTKENTAIILANVIRKELGLPPNKLHHSPKVLVRDLKKGDLFRMNEGGNVLERIADGPAAHSTDTFVARDNDSPSGMRCYVLRGGYAVTRVEKIVLVRDLKKGDLFRVVGWDVLLERTPTEYDDDAEFGCRYVETGDCICLFGDLQVVRAENTLESSA